MEYKDPDLGSALVWIARKLNYPVKIYTKSRQDTATLTYSNIKVRKISDALFILPKEYVQFSI
jgi:hypothetical protein